MQKARGRFQIRRSDGAWFLFLPKRLTEDSGFPFEKGERVKVAFSEDALIARKFIQRIQCSFCLADDAAKLVRTNLDGTAHYICEKCDEEFDE